MKKIGLALLATLSIAYVGGALYFTQYAFPNTTVNGVDRSYQHLYHFFEYNDEYKPLEVVGRGDKTLTIQPDEIELQKKPVNAPALEQNQYLWPVAFFERHEYTVEYDTLYDQQKLTRLLAGSDLMKGQVGSTNAKMVEEETGFVIEPEKIGTKITLDNLEKSVAAQLEAGADTIQIEDAAYHQPNIHATDKALLNEVDFANKLFATKIVYDFEDRQYTFTGQTLVDLYDKEDDGTYTINYDRARALISNMAAETDTFGDDREFTTYYGTTITLPGWSSIYGWLIDVDRTTEEFIGWVEEFHSEETTPFYSQKAMNRGVDEIGDTYIEIDIDDQWMYVWLDGEVIDEGPTVTGQPSYGTPTPVGVNTVLDKMRDRYLVGIEPDTGKSYRSLVNYWFSINWSDIGIHNSTWRTSFGGDIYLWNGSYGCINVIDHLAQTIYHNIPVGTPVITY